MKTSVLAVTVLSLFLGSSMIRAADVIRADNATALNLPGAWSLGVVPGASDVAVWNNTVTVNRSSAIGGNLSWQGIRIGNTGGTLMTIGATAASVLDLGSAGIDMSAATADLVLNPVTNFSAAQSWNIASGRTLTLNPTTSNTGSAAISITGPGAIILSNGTSHMGTGTLTLGGGVQLQSSTATARTILNNLTLASDITLGSALNNGTLILGGNIDIGINDRTITLRSLATDGSVTSLAIGSGNFNATVTGTGTLSLVNGNASGTVRAIIGQNPGTGTATISSDFLIGDNVSLSFGRANVFSTTTDLTVNGRMRMGNGAGSGLAHTVKSLSGNGFIDSGQTTSVTSSVLTIDGGIETSSTTFSGVIENGTGGRGSVSLTKTGSTTQILSGTNTTTGSFSVTGGTLRLGNTSALGFGGINTLTSISGTTVGSGGTLDLNGISGISEPITLNGTGVGGNGALVNNSGTEAVISSGIAGLGLTAGGSGYSAAPVVTIGGTGTGATAVALLGVTPASFSISGGTTVYSAAPSVTISGDNGVRATATAILSGGASGTVTGITITSANAGAGFTAAPVITFSGGTISTPGTNPTGTGNATNFVVGGLSVTNAGSGYTGATPVTFDSGSATASSFLSSVVMASDSSVGGSGNTTINAVVSGSTRSLTKVGSGQVTLNGINTYTGATNVNAGTLLVGSSGSINASSGVSVTAGTLRYDGTTALNRNITLNGGEFAYNSANNYAGALTFTSGTVGGSNLSGLNLTIGSGQTMAPGNSTGALSSGATTWADAGTFEFEINDATGTAGSTTFGWDLANLVSLDITAGVGAFTIQLVSLTSLQAPGNALNFNDSTDYSWLFVDAGSAITGFNANKFVIADQFTNLTTGTFSVVQGIGLDTDKLYINYTAIPEPGTFAMLMGGLGLLAFRRRRRA